MKLGTGLTVTLVVAGFVALFVIAAITGLIVDKIQKRIRKTFYWQCTFADSDGEPIEKASFKTWEERIQSEEEYCTAIYVTLLNAAILALYYVMKTEASPSFLNVAVHTVLFSFALGFVNVLLKSISVAALTFIKRTFFTPSPDVQMLISARKVYKVIRLVVYFAIITVMVFAIWYIWFRFM